MNIRKRSWDRLAAFVSIALLVAFAAGSFYLAELSERMNAGIGTRKLTHEPDFFVEHFSLIRLDAQGQPVFRLSADRMLHFPDDDSSEYERPRLVSLDPGKPLVTLRAERGRAEGDGERTHLYDDVLLTRAPTEGKPSLKVTTDYVLLLSKEDVARTDRPVRIEQGQSVLTGIGMDFYNEDRRLDVRSDVQGTWTQPAPRP